MPVLRGREALGEQLGLSQPCVGGWAAGALGLAHAGGRGGPWAGPKQVGSGWPQAGGRRASGWPRAVSCFPFGEIWSPYFNLSAWIGAAKSWVQEEDCITELVSTCV